ncbi:MAG TPA: Rpn family recombination-promoting nuclease/putative transposase [Skermanella sp.]|jgi:predicted transposase YdaD|nr:Rpn family recombination-promoting nuclease/putative transposase [Skermanella sp.]
MTEPVETIGSASGDRRLLRRHDQFAKMLLDQPGIADAFLRERLPAGVAALLSAEPATDRSESFVDPTLAELRGDRIYSLATRENQPFLVWTMVEHKSSPEADAIVQVLGYLTGVASSNAQRRVNPDGTVWIVPVPVFAVILYHGTDRWSLPTSLGAAYGLPDGMLSAGLLDFRYTLVDLTTIPDAELSRHPELQGGLLMLKYATRDDDPEVTLERLLGAAAVVGLTIVRIVVKYLFGVGDATQLERLRAVLGRVMPGQEDEIMPTIGDVYVAQGVAKGLAQGRALGLEQGHAQAKAETLMRMLRRRFGEVPEAVEQKVSAAAVSDIDNWIDALVDGKPLDAVFEDPTH